MDDREVAWSIGVQIKRQVDEMHQQEEATRCPRSGGTYLLPGSETPNSGAVLLFLLNWDGTSIDVRFVF